MRLCLALSIMLMLYVNAYSAESVIIPYVSVSPEPCRAGEPIKFKVVLLNNGTVIYEKGKLSVELVFFNNKKRFIAKAGIIKNEIESLTGTTLDIIVPYTLNPEWTGKYFYRISVKHRNKTVYESGYYDLNVIPRIKAAKKIMPVEFDGNLVMSYRSRFTETDYQYYGNTNLNTVGHIMESTVMFNLSAFHPQSIASQVQYLMFNYYTKNWYALAGDILPSFSNLSLQGAAMSGLQVATDETKMLYLNTVVANIDTQNLRLFTGGKIGVNLPWNNINAGVTYVSSNDEEGAVPRLGNNVIGGMVGYKLGEVFSINAELQGSESIDRTAAEMIRVQDYAWGVDARIDTGWFKLGLALQETQPEFMSLSAPNVVNDRQAGNFDFMLTFMPGCDFSTAYTVNKSNVENIGSKLTILQQAANIGVNIDSPDAWPDIMIGVNGNMLQSVPDTAQSNVMKGVNIMVIQRFGIEPGSPYFELTAGQNVFEDYLKMVDDTQVTNYSAKLELPIVSWFSCSVGGNQNEVYNITSKVLTQLKGYSFVVNSVIIPEKVVVRVLYGLNTEETDTTLELAWRVTDKFDTVFSVTTAVIIDSISKVNRQENGMDLRVAYSF